MAPDALKEERNRGLGATGVMLGLRDFLSDCQIQKSTFVPMG